MSQLIKLPAHCLDLTPFINDSTSSHAADANYTNSALPGRLGQLISSHRKSPLAPDAFRHMMSSPEIVLTNNKDKEYLLALYERCATSMLSHTRTLAFVGLRWGNLDWANLGVCLTMTQCLEELVLARMESLQSQKLADVLSFAPATMHTLSIDSCKKVTRFTDDAFDGLEVAANLEVLDLTGCENLTKLPSLAPLRKLKELRLYGCRHLQRAVLAGALELPKRTVEVLLPAGGSKQLNGVPEALEED